MQFSQVIGEQTPEDIEKKISRILATGEPVELPDDLVCYFLQRRQEEIQKGEWVEDHYDPGISDTIS